MVAIILLLGAWQVSSCQGYEAVSTIKFITHHGFSVERMPSWYLIHAVKQSSWKIHYGFSDNNQCQSSRVVDKDDFERQLKASLVKAVQLWLQPLRAGSDELVATFELKLQDTVSIVEKSLIDMGADQQVAIEEDDPAHFRITFNCTKSQDQGEYPRSFVMLGTVPQVFMFHYRKPAKDCGEGSDTNCVVTEERDQSEIFPHDKMSAEHMFMMTTLLHELGHIFGLKDVYIETDTSDNKQEMRAGINYSTGGSEKTVGKQPNSIMGVASIIGLREGEEGEFVLTTDDEEAVKWLYLQAHEGVALNLCPTDYEMEKDTDGCVPRFPLIFAVREGDMQLAKKLLAEDDSIDIDTCDRYGNTAVFYAKQGKHGHGDQMEQLLLDAAADPTAKCAVMAQPKAEQPDIVVAEAEETAAEATAAGATAQAFNLKEKLRCSTLAHHDVSSNNLLLLLLILPALLSFPLVAPLVVTLAVLLAPRTQA